MNVWGYLALAIAVAAVVMYFRAGKSARREIREQAADMSSGCGVVFFFVFFGSMAIGFEVYKLCH